MKNCIFCKHREILNDKPTCTSRTGLRDIQLPGRMRFINPDHDMGCNGFRENDLSKVFKRIQQGLENTYNILTNDGERKI